MTAVAELQVRWARMSIVLSESSFESLIAPAVGVQVSVKCRSPLDGGQNVKSYRVLNGQLLFVPSQLSCVGVARGGTALVVRMLGRHTRGANWENQEPRAVYMDTPTVVSLESAGNQDVLFNATRHFRLLHVRTVTLMTKDPFDSQQNGSDELYLPTEVRGGSEKEMGFWLCLVRVRRLYFLPLDGEEMTKYGEADWHDKCIFARRF
jgi:hypothetical protein